MRRHIEREGIVALVYFIVFDLKIYFLIKKIVIVISVSTTSTLVRRYRHSKDFDATGNQVQTKYRQTGPTNEVI